MNKSNIHTKKMELLAPAGGEDQLRAALAFGADAVYLAGSEFGMRARAANFQDDSITSAVQLAHEAGAKVHITCNVMMTQDDMSKLPPFLELVNDAGVDALIIGDAGAFSLARRYAPNCDLHVSTQASVANSEAAKAWYEFGASRIVCAREMTLDDIARMRENIPADLELEAFVHGAQCMAVSGRCLISAYLAERSGNRGDCTQPCRWNYVLEEEKRPGEYIAVDEDARGTYIMNAMDLNMLAHLNDLAQAGVDSIKIEGRNKKAFYVASVVNAYRNVLDGEDPAKFEEELACVSHRPYSTGFFFGKPKQAIDYDGYEQETLHVADVTGCADGRLFLRCRNRLEDGQKVEVLAPSGINELTILDLRHVGELDCNGEVNTKRNLGKVEVANRTSDIYSAKAPFEIETGSFLRIRQHRRTSRSAGKN